MKCQDYFLVGAEKVTVPLNIHRPESLPMSSADKDRGIH